ncbi:MAG TPA: DmsE family decaheme c-type cytochrome [Burkholderiales bacterium]|nr:DmsE family decaheme c-type cytochrome [Burkholderiales bacterium]
MEHANHPLGSVIRGIAMALGLALLAQGATAQEAKPARKDMVLKGDAVCTRCHAEEEEYPVLSIGKTRHGTTADTRTPSCTSCHGASETHVTRPAGAKERPKPERVFGRKSATPPETQNQACLACHQGGKRIHWAGSAHATRDTTCVSCHQVHTAQDRVRAKATQAEVCLACHKEQRAQMNRPSRHPIPEGKVVCSDCHNPHGSVAPKQLARDSVNDTCYTCHMEKRGPFVRTHQPVQEDCSICHNPHGTTTPNLLKARAPFLCQQCHEPTSHRGTIPGNVTGTGTALNRAVVLARGCLNCHTNIHGTNNPIDAAGERTFRR